jgi:hypothetical protein
MLLPRHADPMAACLPGTAARRHWLGEANAPGAIRLPSGVGGRMNFVTNANDCRFVHLPSTAR